MNRAHGGIIRRMHGVEQGQRWNPCLDMPLGNARLDASGPVQLFPGFQGLAGGIVAGRAHDAAPGVRAGAAEILPYLLHAEY